MAQTNLNQEFIAGNEKGLLVAGRYRASRFLRNEEGAQSYLGRDEETGKEVVIKVAVREILQTGGQRRLEHESNLLRRLKLGALAPLIEFGSEEDYIF